MRSPLPGGTEGVYHCDTRHLSHFVITVNERRPIVLSSTLRDDNTTLTCDLANPDLVEDGGVVMEHDLIHIRRTRFLWKASCFERLRVRNFDLQARSLRLANRVHGRFCRPVRSAWHGPRETRSGARA